MPNVPFQVGDGIQIGAAVITASGAAIVLPANTSVGGTQVATSTDVSTGGGPKITNLQITDNSWTVLDDTAVDTAGGYVLITGTNFVSGALVYFNQTPANSVAFVGATTLRVTVSALTAGTYIVYVINPDGGTAIRVPGLTASANPAWQTASALPEQYDGVAITLNLVATDATSYTLTSGSLPPGLSLNANTGVISGTVSGVSVDTTYTFTVRATDAQLQDSPRTFTVTITVSDPYFKLTTLLLSGSALSANTVVRDSSTNNFNMTVYGDSRASNFTPYGTGWSVYFDGTDDFITAPANAAFDFGTNDFTIECWIYYSVSPPSSTAYDYIWGVGANNTNGLGLYIQGGVIKIWNGSSILTTSSNIVSSVWYHITTVRTSSVLTVYLNGFSIGTVSLSSNLSGGSSTGFYIASWNNIDVEDFTGYISNFRVVKGTAVYTANFTPATTNLTSVANTSLLTCHTNRFMDGSANNFTITRNGDARVVSFNPFNITNTGVDGSAYFDGTGDYLSVVDNSAFTLANYNFCIELWIYPTASMANYANFLGQWANSTTNCAYTFRTSVSQNVQFAYTTSGNGQAGTSVDGSALVISSWNHIVVCRNGTTLSIFQNGVRTATHNISTNTISDSSRDQQIGFGTDGSAITGYMSNLRFVTGNSIYDPTLTTLTVPTQPLTAVTNTQLLTLQYDQPHNNHTFLDSSSNQFLITRNGNATQGTFSPFSPGGWSGYFNGSTDGIVIASGSDSYDFNSWMLESTASKTGTIEAWIYLQSYSTPTAGTGVYTHRCIFGRGSTFLNFGVRPDGKLRLYYYNTSSNQNWFESAANAIQLNTWYHVAFVADAGIGKLYINGVYSSGNRINGGTDSGTTAFNGVAVGTFSEGGIHYIGRENAETTTSRWHGYIANFRIVNGQSLYTTNFTPSTSPLTTTSQGVIGTNCKLLTLHTNRFKDDGPNNRIFTLEGTTRIQAFSPFAPTAVYNPTTHGGSAYFDGSGDYLTIGSTSDFILGTNDFCLEAWHYSLTGTDAGLIARRQAQAATGWVLGPRKFAALLGGTWYDPVVGFASSFKKYEWVHTAVTRSGNNWRFFENGVLIDYQTRSGSINDMTQYVVNIGRGASSAEEGPLTGYLTDAALTIGSIPTLYQTNVTTTNTQVFSVPTAPKTPSTNTNFLVKGTDAAIIDSTGRNVIETVADAKTSSVVTKFTGGSMYFDGTGDGLAWPISSTPFYQIVSTNWTIEMWMYKFSTAIKNIMRCGPANAGNINRGWSIGIDPSINTIYFSSSGADNTFTGATIAINTWVHLAFSYTVSDSTLRVFYNGTSAGTKVSPALVNPTIAGGDFLTVATPYSGTAHFDGYLSDIRFTQGYARYTANFTAPTVPARLK